MQYEVAEDVSVVLQECQKHSVEDRQVECHETDNGVLCNENEKAAERGFHSFLEFDRHDLHLRMIVFIASNVAEILASPIRLEFTPEINDTSKVLNLCEGPLLLTARRKYREAGGKNHSCSTTPLTVLKVTASRTDHGKALWRT